MDSEKVIKALRNCVVQNDVGCQGCPYFEDRKEYGYGWCTSVMAQDVLDLMKEQEPVKPDSFMDGRVQRFACKKCGKHLLYAEWGRDNYCSKCGQAVKWE